MGWAHMQLGLHKPHASVLQIVHKPLQDKALKEGEEYEYIPIKPLDPKGPGQHSTPKKEKIPDTADDLSGHLKQIPMQELQQVMSALQKELKNRQDVSLDSAHEVSAVLQTLLKEGALRTQNPQYPQAFCFQWGDG